MVWNAFRAACRRFYRSEFALILLVFLILFIVREKYWKSSIYRQFSLTSEVPSAEQKKIAQEEADVNLHTSGKGWSEYGFRFAKKERGDSWSTRYKNIAVSAIKGHRQYMEDRFSLIIDDAASFQLFGIFDGHGGTFVASQTEEKFLQGIATKFLSAGKSINISKLFIEETLTFDKELESLPNKNLKFVGSTALFGMVHEDKLYLGNVGDCRAVGIHLSEDSATQLTKDHKPNLPSEFERIKKLGGTVIFKGVWRLTDGLAVSRALGDFKPKANKYLIPDPEIFQFDLHNNPFDMLILASDGFWDVFSVEQTLKAVKKYINSGKDLTEHGILFMAQKLVDSAYNKGSMDNITVMIVKL